MHTNRLQEYRSRAKETQRQVAAAMGIKTIGGYCKKELGYHPVTLEEALAAGVSEVTVPALPHGEYLWSPEVRLDMVYCYETRGDLIIHLEEENP